MNLTEEDKAKYRESGEIDDQIRELRRKQCGLTGHSWEYPKQHIAGTGLNGLCTQCYRCGCDAIISVDEAVFDKETCRFVKKGAERSSTAPTEEELTKVREASIRAKKTAHCNLEVFANEFRKELFAVFGVGTHLVAQNTDVVLRLGNGHEVVLEF
jgi:hypothetical protein